MKTFKEKLIEQYARLPQFEVEETNENEIYVWHKDDKVGTTIKFDDNGDIIDMY